MKRRNRKINKKTQTENCKRRFSKRLTNQSIKLKRRISSNRRKTYLKKLEMHQMRNQEKLLSILLQNLFQQRHRLCQKHSIKVQRRLKLLLLLLALKTLRLLQLKPLQLNLYPQLRLLPPIIVLVQMSLYILITGSCDLFPVFEKLKIII